MNYYHIDVRQYILESVHLEPLEDLTYRRLHDLYCTTGGPLAMSIEEIAGAIRMAGSVSIVAAVLSEFFSSDGHLWSHKRLDAYIALRQKGRRPIGARAPGPRPRQRNYPKYKEWETLRRLVFSRDGHQCTYCGSAGSGRSLHCDHILAVSRGGGHELSNLTTACQKCNSSKRDRPVESWRAIK